MRHRLVVFISTALFAAVTGLDSPSARACGGFFCDRPQANAGPPIAQAGENVVFMLDHDPQSGRGLVAAHIQIVYSGAADQFSWIVPVSSLPTVDVGNDLLFQIMEPKTRPTFTVQTMIQGNCKNSASDGSLGCGGVSKSGSSAVPPGAGSTNGSHAVDVAFHGNVGPYETSIVRSDDPAALEDWLIAHQYFVSPEASRIIQDYVAQQNYFVALRLSAGHDVSEIQPVVLKLAAEEGCLPLKLTAIATTPNLRINVWVLGDARAVPLNYTEVELNQAKLDWFGFGANYDQLVSDAANEAGGNAFTTEYAQPTPTAVTWFTLPDNAATLLAGSSSPVGFWTVLLNLGLPLQGRVIQVLRQQIPIPASLQAQGVTEAQFYANLSSYWFSNSASFAPFDAAMAAAAMDAQVLQPMTALKALFSTHLYLTRLATFISAEEMTKDPLFVTNASLPPVANQHMAIARVQCGEQDYDSCSAPVKLDVEDGHTIAYPARAGSCGVYDRTDLDGTMPAASRGWHRDPDGPGDVVLDQTSGIAVALSAHNAAVAVPGGGCGGCAVAHRTSCGSLVATILLGCLALARRRRARIQHKPPAGCG